MNERWNAFQEDFRSLLERNFKINQLEDMTDLTVMDSLAVVETLQLIEEHLARELKFEEVRPLKTFFELKMLLNKKGVLLA